MTPPFSGINHNIYYLTISVGQEPGYAELSGSLMKLLSSRLPGLWSYLKALLGRGKGTGV